MYNRQRHVRSSHGALGAVRCSGRGPRQDFEAVQYVGDSWGTESSHGSVHGYEGVYLWKNGRVGDHDYSMGLDLHRSNGGSTVSVRAATGVESALYE